MVYCISEADYQTLKKKSRGTYVEKERFIEDGFSKDLRLKGCIVKPKCKNNTTVIVGQTPHLFSEGRGGTGQELSGHTPRTDDSFR